MKRPRLVALGVLLACAGAACAESVRPGDFTWRAPLQAPAGAALVRAELPAQALLHGQTDDLRDLRVFNAAGEAVPFALLAPPAPGAASPRARTATAAALPLYAAVDQARPAQGSTEVRIADGAGRRSVWVRMDGSDLPGAPRLDSVLIDTRAQQQALGAIEIHGTLPANAPVQLRVASSADLAQWTTLPVRGRLYRFEGDGAPSNMTLEFERPVVLEGRFLRLDWSGQAGVAVTGATGLLAHAAATPARVGAPLPAARAAGAGALEIATAFATPLAGLALETPVANSLWPVRVLVRNEASLPWRQVGNTVVYRLANGGADATNPALALPGVSARWLRLESTNGADLAQARLQASAEFHPVRLVFVASGRGPFELATGRAAAPAAALPLATITGTLGTRKLDELPLAAVGTPVIQVARPAAWAALWPGGDPPGQATVLWTVLVAGVLVLAAVAWSLLRQMKPPPERSP
ncbi:MAG: DUF3999 family protein [Ramlibacter sp.]